MSSKDSSTDSSEMLDSESVESTDTAETAEAVEAAEAAEAALKQIYNTSPMWDYREAYQKKLDCYIIKLPRRAKDTSMFGFLSASTTTLTDEDATNFVQDLRDVDELNKTRELEKKTPLALHIFLDTDGGRLDITEVIVKALCRYKGKICVFVQTCAMSAGTLIALCAQEIHLMQYAYLGKIDPQIGSGFLYMPSFAIIGGSEKSFKTNWISDIMQLMGGPARGSVCRVITMLSTIGESNGWSVRFYESVQQRLMKGCTGDGNVEDVYGHSKPYDYTDLSKIWTKGEMKDEKTDDNKPATNPKLYDGWPESAKALWNAKPKPEPTETKNALASILGM